MHTIEKDTNSRFKLAQLWHASEPDCTYNGDRSKSELEKLERIVNEILTEDIDINYKVSIGVNNQKYRIHLTDCTALHFVYCGSFNINIFNNVLERGADVTIKNGNGQTALHLMIANSLEDIKNNSIQYINSVLSAQVKLNKSSNPRDNNGISHLHGACIVNHVKALKLFLENGASANETVNANGSIFAGYTPLHFAAHFDSFEAAQMLLDYGANINAKNAEGMSALDLIMECRMKELNHLHYLNDNDTIRKDTYQKNLRDNERIIKLLLDKNAISTIGWSRFHVACTSSDLTMITDLLNEIDDIDHALTIKASFGSGYTALHFAAINSIEAVKFLLEHGAKFETEDVDGLTPLDICLDKCNIDDVYDVLANTESWTKIFMSDGKTKLLDFVKATIHLDQLQLFLQNGGQDLIVPLDSTLWPGYTILHLAVIFSTCKSMSKSERRKTYDDTIVRKCLEISLDINAADTKSRTPLNLAFRLNKDNIVCLLLEHLNGYDEVKNLLDEDNLSYLHIACAMDDDSLVEKLLRTSEANDAYNGNKIFREFIMPGSTPLHIATACGSHTVVEILLRHGADLHKADSNGLTPIHFLLGVHSFKDRRITKVLFSKLLENPKDVIVEGVELSYLHVACYLGNKEVVEELLDLGSNVNAVIASIRPNRLPKSVSKYSGCSPLHLAQLNPVEQVVKSLLLRGADAFAKVTRIFRGLKANIILDCEDITYGFISALWHQPDLQKYMEQRWGLTKLHIACHMKNENAIRSALSEKANVNAQINADLVIFCGYTPLHLLVTISQSPFLHNCDFAVEPSIKMLLDHGADVTALNSKKNTPIHEYYEHQAYFTTDGHLSRDSLLNAHPNFAINPVNAEGLSHFHIACLWAEDEIVDKFLQHGFVNVNQSIDCFARYNAGCTPLHLVFGDSVFCLNKIMLSLIADLLLDHGADITARDVYGDTPLHQSLTLDSPGMDILEKLVRRGADVKSKNIKGQTLFDRWLFDNSIDYASLFMKYGYPFNSWYSMTGEGFIAKIFLSQSIDIAESLEFEKFIQSSDVTALDELGRTVIHNSVAILSDSDGLIGNYIYAIESFIKKGIDIDHQDKSGQTALHYAARMENKSAVEILLKFGADINTVDSNGNSAFFYDMEHAENESYSISTFMRRSTAVFNLYVKKLQYLEIEVSQLNKTLESVLKLVEDEEDGPHFHNPFNINLKRKSRVIFDKDSEDIFGRFFDQLRMTKTINVEKTSFTLFNFVNETGFLTLYPYLPISEQIVINDFFNSDAYKEFDELIGIIKLQFRKMTKRLDLIEPALSSLRSLFGFSVPGLCEEVTRFLTNSDLQSLIASTAK